MDEPVPTLADPFPSDDPLPGAYELHLPSHDVTIWYTVTPHEGQEVISIQHVRRTPNQFGQVESRDVMSRASTANCSPASTVNTTRADQASSA